MQLIVTKPKATVARAKTLINRIQRNSDTRAAESQTLGLIETIVVYKFPHLDRKVIAAMLGIEELKQTRVYQDALEEGRQEGRQEGQCQLLLKLLTLKIGELPQASVDAVETLSEVQLNRLSEQLLDIATLTDLEGYLASDDLAASDLAASDLLK
ncbi:MAG: DUF4351 domain-containing protein [Cyanobacteria bacterium J06598_3]